MSSGAIGNILGDRLMMPFLYILLHLINNILSQLKKQRLHTSVCQKTTLSENLKEKLVDEGTVVSTKQLETDANGN